MESKNQIIIILVLSCICSFEFNFFRSEGSISLKSVPLSLVQEVEGHNPQITEPSIRIIELDLAKKLHANGVLFVDARAEEYIIDGMIPDAVYNDNFDSLAEQINNIVSIDTVFVVYCSDDDCGSSEELAVSLQEQGFMNIFLFKGGWKQWVENKLPVNR